MPTSSRKGKRLIECPSPAQCRGARAMLRWSQGELAAKSGISKPTVTDYEREARKPMPKNLEALREALEGAGIEFLEDEGVWQGVRLRTTAATGAADDTDEAEPPSPDEA